MNSKGLELSINFLVVIILGIAMLAGGIALLRSAFSGSQELQSTVDERVQAQLDRLMDDGTPVVVLDATKTTERDEPASFSIGIENTLETTAYFKIKVAGSDYKPIFLKEVYELKNNERKFFIVSLLPDNAPKQGSATMTVEYCATQPSSYDDSCFQKYTEYGVQKLYVTIA